MVIPVSGPQGPKAADKTKAKARTDGAGGASFADLLAAAEQPEAALPPQSSGLSGNLTGLAYVPLEEEQVPADTRGQTTALLKQLRELAQAALGGQGVPSWQQLQNLAEAVGTDDAALTPQQRQAVNEARTRAAVEAAKNTKS